MDLKGHDRSAKVRGKQLDIGAGLSHQSYVSWRIIEMDGGEVDVRHQNVWLCYNRED